MPTLIFPILVFLSVEIFSLAYGHSYEHWAKVIGKTLPDPKRLITNYTYGILSIFIPFTGWVFFTWIFQLIYSLLTIFTVMWIFIGAGGATVKWLYWHDAKVKERQKLKDDLEKQELLIRQMRVTDAEQTRQRQKDS